MIREPRHRHSADLERIWQARHRRSQERPFSQVRERRIDRVDECGAEASLSFVVPRRGSSELRRSLSREPDRKAQRGVLVRSRSRKADHDSPSSSPERARRARTSSSSAHAARTASASSATGSSRLARSSAATAARAPLGSASASRRTASESIDIGSQRNGPTRSDQRALTRTGPHLSTLESAARPLLSGNRAHVVSTEDNSHAAHLSTHEADESVSAETPLRHRSGDRARPPRKDAGGSTAPLSGGCAFGGGARTTSRRARRSRGSTPPSRRGRRTTRCPRRRTTPARP